MELRGRDIVCLSSHYWDEPWFRKQEFMSRFSEKNRVLFVEPSFSMARRPETFLRGVATNRYLVPRLERRAEGLYLLKPPRGLPKWTVPAVERLTYRWYGGVVGRVVDRLGFRDAILWVYRPSYYHGIRSIPHGQLVFDLIDDLPAYSVGDVGRARKVEDAVDALARRSDLLVVTAKTLLERYGPRARHAVHVPNGFDSGLFSGSRDSHGAPEAYAGLRRPILAYVGTLFTFLDYPLLEAVSRAHSDKSLVLVGPVEATAAEAVDALLRLPNVHYLGRVPRAAVPAYVGAADVCLNPFRVGAVADSVNPLKVYEYLALGKPVVSSPMKALQMEDVASVIAFAAGPEAFSAAISGSLERDDGDAARSRSEAVAGYAWDRLFARLDACCAEALAR